MSAVVTEPTVRPDAGRADALAARPPAAAIPLSRVTRVELRKMFDTRSGFWLMASIVITSVLATTAVVLFAPDEELTYATFSGAIGVPMAVVLPLIAILSVTSEWSQRSGLTTFTLVPHRGRVVLGKALAALTVAVTSMLLAFGIGALGTVAGSAIAGVDQTWDVAAVDVGNVVLGNVLSVATGFVLGLLLRSSPMAVGGYFVVAFVLPTLSQLLAAAQEWFRDVQGWVDPNTAQAALLSLDGALSTEQWAQLGVTSLVWLVLPLAAGLRLVMRSEIG